MNFKKILMIVMAMLFLTASVMAATPEVKVLDPNGDETITKTNYTIEFEVRHDDDLEMEAFFFLDDDQDLDNGVADFIDSEVDLDNDLCESNDFTDWVTCEYEVDLGNFDDGEYYLGIEVTDTDNEDDLDFSNDRFEIDTQGPEFKNLYPKDNATTNRRNQVISAVIVDDGSGVNPDTVAMRVEGENFNLDDEQLSFKASTGKVTFNAGTVFQNGQTVNVTVEAEDEAGHLEQKSWRFTIDTGSDSAPDETEDDEDDNVTEGENSQIFMAPAFEELTLEAGRGLDVPFTFESSARESVCGKVTVETDDPYIYATMAMKEVCLNKNEKTSTALAIFANRKAEKDVYTVTVTMNVNGTVSEQELEVKVGYDTGIDIEFLDTKANANVGRNKLRIELTNRLNSTKTVSLRAENGRLLPLFEPQEIELQKNKPRQVELIVHTPQPAELGSFPVDIIMEADGLYSKERFYIEMADLENHYLELEVEPSELEMEKNETAEIAFTVYNDSNDKQRVKFVADGTLVTNVVEDKLVIDSEREASGTLEITTRNMDMAGDHEIKLYAYTDTDTVETVIKVFVVAVSNVDLELDTNSVEVNAGESTSFNAVMINTGDFNEAITVATVAPEGINLYVKDYPEELLAREEASAAIVVAVDSTVEAGDYNGTVRLLTSSGQKEVNINIKVKGINVLKINSYPTELVAVAGETKTLVFSITNTSSMDADKLELSLNDLPVELNFEPVQIRDLKAGETRLVKGKMKVKASLENDELPVEIELANGYFNTKKKVFMKVNVTAEPIVPGITGFMSLGSFAGLGLLMVLAAVVFHFGRKWSEENQVKRLKKLRGITSFRKKAPVNA